MCLPPRLTQIVKTHLNSLMNVLLDNPITHCPVPWILSLNWFCQKWGQSQALSCDIRGSIARDHLPRGSSIYIMPVGKSVPRRVREFCSDCERRDYGNETMSVLRKSRAQQDGRGCI